MVTFIARKEKLNEEKITIVTKNCKFKLSALLRVYKYKNKGYEVGVLENE